MGPTLKSPGGAPAGRALEAGAATTLSSLAFFFSFSGSPLPSLAFFFSFSRVSPTPSRLPFGIDTLGACPSREMRRHRLTSRISRGRRGDSIANIMSPSVYLMSVGALVAQPRGATGLQLRMRESTFPPWSGFGAQISLGLSSLQWLCMFLQALGVQDGEEAWQSAAAGWLTSPFILSSLCQWSSSDSVQHRRLLLCSFCGT